MTTGQGAPVDRGGQLGRLRRFLLFLMPCIFLFAGDLVRFPLGRVPRTLAAALACRRDELRGVRVVQGATAYPLAWATDSPGWEEHIAYVTDYITPLVRPCLDARSKRAHAANSTRELDQIGSIRYRKTVAAVLVLQAALPDGIDQLDFESVARTDCALHGQRPTEHHRPDRERSW